MALKIGIVGPPNSGKSYSRTFIEKGEEVFVIAPSHKMTHITTSNGEPIKQLVKDDKGNYVSGNWTLCPSLDKLPLILDFVQKLPHIKVVILPDFTHFISKIIADPNFIKRKAGGEAFQRFWELASDTLNNFILSLDYLREDLIIITEYHSEYDESLDSFKIFVPGGKMLEEKFKLDSYYDFMLYTHTEQKESGEIENYYFVTKKWKKYNARFANLFEDVLIPNNLQLVLDTFRKASGI